MDSAKIIKVFVGSPSDTAEERSQIQTIIDELNQTLGVSGRVEIKSIMWENNVNPTVGSDAQEVINVQTRDYDIFVGIMWKKYGFPTPRAGSATDEEYTYAIDSFKRGGHCKDIIFMFSNKPFNIDDADPDQIQKVKNFKKRLEQDGVFYKKYTSIDDFTSQLRIALYRSIVQLLKGSNSNARLSKNNVRKNTSIDNIDEQTKLVFDTLSISPAVNSVKSKFIESYILLYLFDKKKASSLEINNYLCKILRSDCANLYNSVISKLNQSDRLEVSVEGKVKYFSLTEITSKEIESIKLKAEESNKTALIDCQAICEKYDLCLDINEVHDYICKLFATNYSIDNGELVKGSINREKCLKQIFFDLVNYIHSSAAIPASFAEPIAREFVSVYSKNQSFYKSYISKMFLSLFQNEKLEEYLANAKRDLILDTQVLLQICCVSFSDCSSVHSDVLYNVGLRFWENVKSNAMINLYTTSGYIQEVASHMQQAVNLSRFLSLDYIADLGKSKNIFFNHYMMIKENMNYSNFEDYVSEMLDLEPCEIESRNFKEKAYQVISKIFEDLSIKVLRHQEVKDFTIYKKEYETELSYSNVSRSYDAIINDINAAIIAGNYFEDFSDTAYIVTLDSIFVKVRDRFAEKFQETLSFWNVFNPQKISEMLTLIHFNVDPSLVDENIISLTESNFNTSNDSISFIDLLNTIIDQKELGDWKLAIKLSKLRKLCKANFEDEKLSTVNLPIDEILLDIVNTMTSNRGVLMSDLKALFCDNDYADRISELITKEIEHNRTSSITINEETYDILIQMINEKKYNQLTSIGNI